MNKIIFSNLMQKRIEKYKEILKILNEKNIDYMNLTDLEVEEIGDVDIITDEKGFHEIETILLDNNFLFSEMFQNQQLYSTYIDNVGFLKIHIHCDFYFYGKCILKYKDIKNMNYKEINFILFLIESFFRMKNKPEKFKKLYIDNLSYSNDIIEYMIEKYKQNRFPTKKDIFLKILKKHHIYFVFYMLKRYFIKLKRLINNNDIDIAILGVDGAGKSTTINNLEYIFSKGAAIYPFSIYSGLRESFINNIREKFSKKEIKQKKDTNNQKINKNNKLSLKQKIYQIFIVLLYIFEFNIRYVNRKYILPKYSQSLWVYDRYFFDLLLYYKSKEVKWLVKHLLIKPDYIFFLTGDIQKLYERKKENSLEELKKYNDMYINILEYLEIPYNIIDTTENKEEDITINIQNIISEIWRKIS